MEFSHHSFHYLHLWRVKMSSVVKRLKYSRGETEQRVMEAMFRDVTWGGSTALWLCEALWWAYIINGLSYNFPILGKLEFSMCVSHREWMCWKGNLVMCFVAWRPWHGSLQDSSAWNTIQLQVQLPRYKEQAKTKLHVNLDTICAGHLEKHPRWLLPWTACTCIHV